MNQTQASLDRDLTHQPPHSPHARIGDFVIACRTVDKCRATINGTAGEYHYDCPLDNELFSFKGINGAQFKEAVKAAKSYEDIGAWLLSHGTPRTTDQIREWSKETESASMRNNPDKRDFFIEQCSKLGLDPEQTTTFDWLDADDRASFAPERAG